MESDGAEAMVAGRNHRGFGRARRAAAALAAAAALSMVAVAFGATNLVSTDAGTGSFGFSGDGGRARAAQLNTPTALTTLPDGGYLIADQGNSRVRKVSPDGTITTVAGSGGVGAGGDGGPALAATFDAINGIAATAGGGILITDSNNNRVRYVDPAGVIHTVAGTGAATYGGDGGPASRAQLSFPSDVAVQPDGGYLIADSDNHRVRRVAPDGTISTVAGNGVASSTGDGGPATAATVNKPEDVAVLPGGGFLISELYGSRIRRVARDGTISTVAGTGTAGSGGDDGPATAAQINYPLGITATADGGFMFADARNHRIRRVTSGGTIETVVGTGTSGDGADGLSGPATALNEPFDVELDAQGDILVVDTFNHRVRRLDIADEPVAPPPAAEPVPEPVVGPAPEPVAEPAPEPVAERNVTRPTILALAGNLYTCSGATWEGLAADPALSYQWERIEKTALGLPLGKVVGSGETYSLPAAARGKSHYCTVSARGESGRVMEASSDFAVLSGIARRPILPLGPRLYGDFRIRGIDVVQTTQPRSGAQQYGFPGPTAFTTFCGGGTPTAYFDTSSIEGLGPGDCSALGRNVQRVPYRGVSVDGRKTAYAFVYLDMNGVGAGDRQQRLEVTLTGFVNGARLGSVTRSKKNPPRTTWPWVSEAERLRRDNFVLVSIPPTWLTAAGANGKRLDLEAQARIPTGAGAGTLIECPVRVLALGGSSCSKNNRFRLTDVPVYTDLNILRIRALPLTKPGQTLSAPRSVLNRVIQLLPGGSQLQILPADAAVEVDPEAITASDKACSGITLRSCRMDHMNEKIEKWQALSDQNLVGYHMLMAYHDYESVAGEIEPGWKRDRTTTIANGIPTIVVNDGSAKRPLTAAAHEFLHALGAPHADTGLHPISRAVCGGNSGDQEGEEWLPDRAGRIQGVKFDIRRALGAPINITLAADADTAPLFDLMSYCARNDVSAWLSPRNWNRAMAALRPGSDGGMRVARPRAVGGPMGFVVGSLRPGGARIGAVVPAGPDVVLPKPDEVPVLTARARNAAGNLLAETPATVTYTVGGDGGGTFIAGIPPGTESVEVVDAAGGVDDHREASRPPAVRLDAPRPGAVRGSVDVRWTASDPDGDPLQARVEYSDDGGRSWRTVLMGLRSGHATVPGRYLAGTDRGRIRVVVDDGFGEASAVSGALRVPGAPPTVTITSPAAAQELPAGKAVLLGSAVDAGRRSLRGRALTWFAGKRRLGTGERVVARLRPGVTTLRLVARDRRGTKAESSHRVVVTRPLLRLTTLRPPDRVALGARGMRVRIATSVPARATIGGRSFRVGPKARSVRVRLPAATKPALSRVGVTVRAGGQPRLRETLLVARL